MLDLEGGIASFDHEDKVDFMVGALMQSRFPPATDSSCCRKISVSRVSEYPSTKGRREEAVAIESELEFRRG